MLNPESTQFGERRVTPEEKTEAVRGVFDSVAGRYDLMNDLMSGGVHRLWKDRLVRMIRPRPGLKYLDVAGGTGDIAFRIHKKAPDSAITICDLNQHMLEVGRNRAIDKGWLRGFEWVTGNAESLPFPSASFDVYTIAFGLRNVTHIDTALAEAARVLKPGGRFFCLEFSHVQEPLLAKAYDLFSFKVIPQIGKVVTGDQDSYQYLVESIRKFPPQKELARRMEAAGLKNAGFTNLSAGIATIHHGIRP
ncbi:MAG TPA: bifunctional demethylmenaquinone methyltransferase/2-methoxy-6-polyprenyl-1,4-benzoquinol methylase UbiE [Rhodospirillaceae bacterium]|nr:bifunctional demethylmenaquinone methyltransferase/2-methoxy-6-polyprenyl-1,4-benzoquinol methylase UbiE [Rhodospirillaceae bacterium]